MSPRPGRALFCGLALATCAAAPAYAVPGYAAVKAAWTPSTATLLARDARPLQDLRLDHTVRRHAWTPLGAISPALRRAVVLSEDRRFFEHGGIDWRAAGSAAWDNLRGGKVRGASTLSMQLAGLIDEDARRRGRRSMLAKLTQAGIALRLDGQWRKGEILEAYLNLAPFRGELQGVAAMSHVLFGKSPAGLDEREAALAAALLRAPNAPAARVAQRACALLKEMQRAGECAGLESLATLALSGALRPDDNASAALAPHLAHKLLVRPGQTVKTTLDADLQRFASGALRRHLAALARQNVEDGAVVVIDNANGDVLAWVGSSGDLSAASAVDGVVALRQAGSTLKPFLYALAFERRNLTPASLIEDAPLSLATGNGLYTPQNYEPHYRGWVSARHALGGSLNVPAVKTLVRLGAEPFRLRLRQAGLESLKEDGDWYGYSLALGSADVSLLMLANAYRTLANGGAWSPLRVAATSPCRDGGCAGVFAGRPRQAFSTAAAFLVTDILADGAARAGTFGLESWLATPYWAAVKTGTSKDMRDNWCLGHSRRYTVAVWVGNANGGPMHDVSGIAGAAPVWREVMDWLHRGDPARGRPTQTSTAPAAPPGIVRTALRFEPPHEPARTEWFIAGTQTQRVVAARTTALAHIAYPADGTVIALDADIPPTRQRLPLRLSAPGKADWQWQLDGKSLGTAQAKKSWLPQPGHHRLALHDANGKELDAVRFEVRALRGPRQGR